MPCTRSSSTIIHTAVTPIRSCRNSSSPWGSPFASRSFAVCRWTGTGRPVGGALRRNAGLILIGFVIYHLDGQVASWAELRGLSPSELLARAFRRELFQALVHIALASIWVLPVIAAGLPVRVLYLLASAGLHLWLSSRFYLDWAWNTPVIDGGPLGFLSWTIPLLVGSLAYDAVAAYRDPRRLAAMLGAWSIVVMLAGYAISCAGGGWAPPPFVPPASSQRPDLWTMSQRTGSISYLTFAAGFSLAVYALFVLACDLGHFQSRLFRTFGVNALAAYIIHPLVAGAVKPYAPNDSPLWYVALGFRLLLRDLLSVQPISRGAPDLPQTLTVGRRSRPAVSDGQTRSSSSSSGPSSLMASARRASWRRIVSSFSGRLPSGSWPRTLSACMGRP